LKVQEQIGGDVASRFGRISKRELKGLKFTLSRPSASMSSNLKKRIESYH